MPYVLGANTVLAVTMRGKHELQDVMTVLHYRLKSPSSLPDGVAAINAFWTVFSQAGKPFETWRSCLSEMVANIHTQIQSIDPIRFAYVNKIKVGADSGSVAGDAYPVNTAAAITKRTLNAGRDQVGTIHMPGVPIGGVVNGALTVGQKALYDLFGVQVLGTITTVAPDAEWVPVLFHRSSPGISPIIEETTTQPFARVMRRRTVGVGS